MKLISAFALVIFAFYCHNCNGRVVYFDNDGGLETVISEWLAKNSVPSQRLASIDPSLLAKPSNKPTKNPEVPKDPAGEDELIKNPIPNKGPEPTPDKDDKGPQDPKDPEKGGNQDGGPNGNNNNSSTDVENPAPDWMIILSEVLMVMAPKALQHALKFIFKGLNMVFTGVMALP